MHRSGSTTRASDEFHVGMVAAAVGSTPASAAGGKGGSPGHGGSGLLEASHHHHGHHLLLPKYDPQSDFSKKEAAARGRSVETAVHLIPLVLIACALILWLFSSPQINMTIKADSLVAKIESLTIEGDPRNDTHHSLPLDQDAIAAAAEQIRKRSTSTGGGGGGGASWRGNEDIPILKV